VLALLTAKEDDVATTLLMLPFAFQDFEVSYDCECGHTGIEMKIFQLAISAIKESCVLILILLCWVVRDYPAAFSASEVQ
jgi:hypothetical protein